MTTVLAKVISFMDERQDDLDRAASLSAPGSSGISMPSTKVRSVQNAHFIDIPVYKSSCMLRKLGVQKDHPIAPRSLHLHPWTQAQPST